MDDRDAVALAEWYVERMQHLVNLASVTDSVTLLRYIAAVHFENRARFDALRPVLEADDVTIPVETAN